MVDIVNEDLMDLIGKEMLKRGDIRAMEIRKYTISEVKDGVWGRNRRGVRRKKYVPRTPPELTMFRVSKEMDKNECCGRFIGG